MDQATLFRVGQDKQLEIVGCGTIGSVDGFTRDELDKILMVKPEEYYTFGNLVWLLSLLLTLKENT